MKLKYISPIIETIDIYNNEQILAGSLKATDGFGNDPNNSTPSTNPDQNFSMIVIEDEEDGDEEISNLSKGGRYEW